METEQDSSDSPLCPECGKLPPSEGGIWDGECTKNSCEFKEIKKAAAAPYGRRTAK